MKKLRIPGPFPLYVFCSYLRVPHRGAISECHPSEQCLRASGVEVANMQVGDDLDSCGGYVLWSGSVGVYLFVNLAIVK